jgi:hypothetical protein
VLVGSESVVAWSRDGGGGVAVRMGGRGGLLVVSGPVW